MDYPLHDVATFADDTRKSGEVGSSALKSLTATYALALTYCSRAGPISLSESPNSTVSDGLKENFNTL
jgi:hypothetical protein